MDAADDPPWEGFRADGLKYFCFSGAPTGFGRVQLPVQNKAVSFPARISEGGSTALTGWMRGGSTKTIITLTNMLSYALIFLIIAILAGVLGFGVIAGTAAMVAKVCFVVFLVLFLFSLFSGGRRSL